MWVHLKPSWELRKRGEEERGSMESYHFMDLKAPPKKLQWDVKSAKKIDMSEISLFLKETRLHSMRVQTEAFIFLALYEYLQPLKLQMST